MTVNTQRHTHARTHTDKQTHTHTFYMYVHDTPTEYRHIRSTVHTYSQHTAHSKVSRYLKYGSRVPGKAKAPVHKAVQCTLLKPGQGACKSTNCAQVWAPEIPPLLVVSETQPVYSHSLAPPVQDQVPILQIGGLE